jgi:hypothetical protein
VLPVIAIAATAIAAGLAFWFARRPADDAIAVRFPIFPPSGATPLASDGRLIEIGTGISPDGRMVAFVAAVNGRPMLWIRPLDGDARPLAGTEGIARSAWSPDSRHIAFVADGALKKVAIAGGPPAQLCKFEDRDIAWAPGNAILVGGGGRPLTLLSPDSCERTAATSLASGETTHDYPHFLPGGRRFIYMARHGTEEDEWNVYVAGLDSGERQLVPGIHSGVRYSSTGHLLFARDGVLLAQPFDATRGMLSG